MFLFTITWELGNKDHQIRLATGLVIFCPRACECAHMHVCVCTSETGLGVYAIWQWYSCTLCYLSQCDESEPSDQGSRSLHIPEINSLRQSIQHRNADALRETLIAVWSCQSSTPPLFIFFFFFTTPLQCALWSSQLIPTRKN